MKKFSVVLPVLNGGEYVKACIRSVLAQTVNDFDLIVLDNCSNDGTYEWICSLNDSRIRIYRSDQRLSIEENWKRVLSVPKNEFMTLIGHDDLLYPDFLLSIGNLMLKYPNAGLYHTHFHFIDKRGEIIRNCRSMPEFLTGIDLLQGFLTQTVDSMGTGYVMRSKDYDAKGGIPVGYPRLLFADFELWLRLAEVSGMAVHQNVTFAFRVHESTTGTASDVLLHQALNKYVDFLEYSGSQNPAFKSKIKECGNKFLQFYTESFAHRLLRNTVEKRGGITVASFVQSVKLMAPQLGIANFNPFSKPSVLLAYLIDSNIVTRNSFRIFRNWYGKPFS